MVGRVREVQVESQHKVKNCVLALRKLTKYVLE